MEIKVLKFGGSSLADAEQFKKVKDIIKAEKCRRYVVPSAPGKAHKDDTKITDLLYKCYELSKAGEDISECYFMVRILKENGVPETAIIAENNAFTTRENMIFGTLMLNRVTKLVDINEIMIITSAWHMKRSLALAKCFLPRKVSPIGGPAPLPCNAEQWIESKENLELVDNEIKYIKRLVDNKIID